jgi:homoserine kinase type II
LFFALSFSAALHGDVFLENMLFDGDNIVALIDFEEASQGAAILDVAMTLVGCCYDDSNKLNLDLAEELIASYHKKHPLSSDEQKHFIDYLIYSLYAIAFWRFRQFNVRSFDEKRCNTYQDMITRLDNLPEKELSAILAKVCS